MDLALNNLQLLIGYKTKWSLTKVDGFDLILEYWIEVLKIMFLFIWFWTVILILILVSFFNGISTFKGYLMPKLSL